MKYSKLITSIVLFVLLTAESGFSQNREKYQEWFMKANNAGLNFEDSLAIVYYRKAFSYGQPSAQALYGMALSFGNLSRPDSAMHYLEQAVSKGFDKVDWIERSPNFDESRILYAKRWKKVMDSFNESIKSSLIAKGHDANAYFLLDSLSMIDYRLTSQMAKADYEGKTEVLDSLSEIADDFYLSAVKELKEMINRLGSIPNYSNVGKKGETKAFLLVQHCGDMDFMQYYLKEMTQLGIKKVNGEHIALLTDRIRIRLGQKQLYGTQIDPEKNEFFPIEKPGELSKRLRELQLGTIESWLVEYSQAVGIPMPEGVK